MTANMFTLRTPGLFTKSSARMLNNRTLVYLSTPPRLWRALNPEEVRACKNFRHTLSLPSRFLDP